MATPPGPGSYKRCLCTAPEDRRVQHKSDPPLGAHPRSKPLILESHEVCHAHKLVQEENKSCANTGRPPTACPGLGVMVFLPAVIFHCFY